MYGKFVICHSVIQYGSKITLTNDNDDDDDDYDNDEQQMNVPKKKKISPPWTLRNGNVSIFYDFSQFVFVCVCVSVYSQCNYCVSM